VVNIYPMKQFYFYITCLFFCSAAQATDSLPFPAAKNANEGGIQFQFNTTAPSDQRKDSVLIIFDRYNHTGAGIIYKVYSADKDHCITIPSVPAGKYYVTIQCLGLHRDRLEKLVRIKSKKKEKITIDLKDSEEFSKEKVVIPVYHPNFANLAVLKTK
jgi:hypothetical protein